MKSGYLEVQKVLNLMSMEMEIDLIPTKYFLILGEKRFIAIMTGLKEVSLVGLKEQKSPTVPVQKLSLLKVFMNGLIMKKNIVKNALKGHWKVMVGKI